MSKAASRRRLILLGIAVVPAVACGALSIRGRNTVDHLAYTNAIPQWQIQLTISGTQPLLIFVTPQYDAESWSDGVSGSRHDVEHKAWRVADFRPSPPVFDVLGAREFRYGYVGQKNDYAALVVPAWLVWMLALTPVAYVLRVQTERSWGSILSHTFRAGVAAVLLIPLVLSVIIWWRSYLAWDMIEYTNTNSTKSLYFSGGWVVAATSARSADSAKVFMIHDPGAFPAESAEGVVNRNTGSSASVRTLGPIYAEAKRPNTRALERALAIPLWAVTLLAVLPPCAVAALAARRWRAAARRAKGLCARCGYDLRASPERCPECGAIVPGADCPNGHASEHLSPGDAPS